MSQVIIVNTQAEATRGLPACYSVLGFRTIIPTSTIVGANEDPDYPFANCLDYRDNTLYSPNINSGTVQIEIRQATSQVVNYLGFAIHNSQSAGLSGSFEYWDGQQWVFVFDFNGLTDDKTFVSEFSIPSAVRFRLTLNFTSKLYIGAIYLGEAILMPSTPDTGFQPGNYGWLDDVTQFTTDGNNFIIGRRESKGMETKGKFSYLSWDFISPWYLEYQNHVLDSKPIFLKWENLGQDSFFGVQKPDRMTRPTYKTGLHTDINFEMVGRA